jgi:drug/metabolite transporter (DMT)-like permease
MVALPIFGALASAGGTILERSVLKIKKIDTKLYQTASFLAIVIVMIPFLYFIWNIKPEAASLKNLIIFGLVIIFSVVANLFTYYSMKWEKVSNLEPAKLLQPLFVILLAIIFSFFVDHGLYERNLKVIIPAIIAGLAIIFSHLKKYHFDFNKYFVAAIFGSFFFALELVISRLILDYYSAITFYFLRSLSIFLVSLILFRPDFSKLDKKSSKVIALTSIVWVVYRVTIYYGYTHLGIISTTLMIMLEPIFLYFLAWKFLKEKPTKRNIVAAGIILACVLYGTLA